MNELNILTFRFIIFENVFDKKKIQIVHISNKLQLIDALTKGVKKQKFQWFFKAVNLLSLSKYKKNLKESKINFESKY